MALDPVEYVTQFVEILEGRFVGVDEDKPAEWYKDNSELMLNVDNPFEKVVNDMVQLQRVKSQDYAADGDILKNMREVVQMLGIREYTVVEDCNAMVHRKSARINNLRGRAARNESVRDSYVDRAVYAILAIVALDEEVTE